jgi:hypothetical protein
MNKTINNHYYLRLYNQNNNDSNYNMKIFYGIEDNKIDVTDICLTKLTNNHIVTIPFDDNIRAKYFTDPLFGTHKKIFILFHDFTFEYDENTHVKIDLIRKTITTINEFDIDKKLKNIQTKLHIKNGSLDHELPEQKMAVRNLTGKEKVLEIGGT